MTNTLLSIFCALSLVALAKPKQVNVGPQTFDDTYSPSKTENINNEYEDNKQVIILYLTPSEMKALSNSKDTVNALFQTEVEKEQKQPDIQNYNQQQLNENKQDNKMYSSDVELKAELRGLLSHNSFYPRENNFENQPWSYDFSKVVTEQMPKEKERKINSSDLNKNQPRENQQDSSQENQRNLQQENALNKQWKNYNPESAIKENVFRYEQLKQQWNNIAYQNPSQIKSSIYQNQNTKEINVENNKDKGITQNYNEEKSEVEKQIESIVKQQKAAEDTRQSALAQAEAGSKELPILIHKEVSITRHLPVPVLKKVKIPTPVLVPIPEPYEVRIPHPYPVPYKVIKHIPIPVVKKY